jgi:hypothetical protein
MVIAILVIIILFLYKCSGDARKDAFIYENNLKVSQDSVKHYQTKSGNLVSEKGVLIAKNQKMKGINDSLKSHVNDLKKELDVKPSVVIRTVTKIVHDTVYLKNTRTTWMNDSTVLISFVHDTTYDNLGNSRFLSGSVLTQISKLDSVRYSAEIKEFKLERDEMNIVSTLVLGETDDKGLKVSVVSKYPNFKANEIDALILDPKIHPKLRKLDKRKFGVGPMIGVGVSTNGISPYIGIGLQYNLIKF